VRFARGALAWGLVCLAGCATAAQRPRFGVRALTAAEQQATTAATYRCPTFAPSPWFPGPTSPIRLRRDPQAPGIVPISSERELVTNHWASPEGEHYFSWYADIAGEDAIVLAGDAAVVVLMYDLSVPDALERGADGTTRPRGIPGAAYYCPRESALAAAQDPIDLLPIEGARRVADLDGEKPWVRGVCDGQTARLAPAYFPSQVRLRGTDGYFVFGGPGRRQATFVVKMPLDTGNKVVPGEFTVAAMHFSAVASIKRDFVGISAQLPWAKESYDLVCGYADEELARDMIEDLRRARRKP
jgi:hypothetical protein